jgi:hypothetical protein
LITHVAPNRTVPIALSQSHCPMSTLPNLLRSLLLTSIFSFLAPVLLIGTILASLALLGYVPGLEVFGKAGVGQVAQFLKVFGSTSALRGLVTIGIACSVVGVLFDAYTFYRYQNLRDQSTKNNL